ncbi:hypothetical protein M422DRAFT_258060 [Sphaerobolus stellatus SS14]|uniref:Uncharacterized protein n=1 Tax=Sphaerobolus stellatus (strain SS14) TaxID=990650 RepID=A0A0C9VMJ3_SPHS4|nr:hypothetical protein M422DRAFT_258060 [Sphaerobolus stellatus SS14]
MRQIFLENLVQARAMEEFCAKKRGSSMSRDYQVCDVRKKQAEIAINNVPIECTMCQGTPLDFCPEYFRPELPLTSSTLWERFRAGFTLSTFVDSCGRRVGGLVGDSGRLEPESERVANIPSFALTDESPDASEATAPESPSQQPFGIPYGNPPAMTTEAERLNTLELTLAEECLKTERIENQLQQLIELLNPARAATEPAPPGNAPFVQVMDEDTGTLLDFRPEYFRPELPLASTTLRERFHTGFTLSTFVDFCGRRVGGLAGDSGRLVEGICASIHSA